MALFKHFNDLAEHGALGDWCFMANHDGVEDAYIVLWYPDGRNPTSKDMVILPVKPDAHLPAGHAVWNWNGNREAPTLTPSIGVGPGHGPGGGFIWHGFLTDGKLVTV